jgi:hypothetical protein
MQVKIFRGVSSEQIEQDVNRWLSPKIKVNFVFQSESKVLYNEEIHYTLTLTIFYSEEKS